MKMMIGVISDTHLRRVNKGFREIYDKYLSDKDLILHAGDIVCTEVVDFLGRNSFQGVYGNMDPVEVRKRLDAKKIIELGPYRIGLIHGWGASAGLEDRIWTEFKNIDVIIYGHTHNAANHMREGVLIFNPGTATGYSLSGVHSIGVLELDHTIRGEIITLDG
ncbi:MAG: metallophosphoesterase family protein [Desulfobacteraceae bacterium]|jgi:putative phosphoesterase|nr:MAG: metallophosphoesterase family protein [Desulfobacteraceae bacterium]